jgi:hypothetical protein
MLIAQRLTNKVAGQVGTVIENSAAGDEVVVGSRLSSDEELVSDSSALPLTAPKLTLLLDSYTRDKY